MKKSYAPVEIENRSYIYLSPNESHALTVQLAHNVTGLIEKGKIEKPDLVVGVARGALVFVKTMADWLNIEDIATLRVVHYTDVGKRLPKPTLLQSTLPRADNRRVVLIDNVVETGKTMQLSVDYLKMCGVDQITTGVLFTKKSSKFVPDVYAAETGAWVIFHFDIVESVKMLGSRWLNSEVGLTEVYERFVKIGLPEKEVLQAMEMIFNYSH
jgi:hypoxanthine phosphoribosyltransferase